jgi:surface antigen
MDAPAPGSRRALRLAEAAAAAHSKRTPLERPVPAIPTPQPQVKRPEVFSYDDLARPIPSVKKTPRKKVSFKKRVSSFATILAVAGFFASVCIPAVVAGGGANADSLDAPVAAAKVTSEGLEFESATTLSAERESFGATTATDLASQRNNALKEANFAAYQASGARELGDDYPWFSELSNNQGGGLSPLNYYYRECVDFVAWRLNRDAGSTSAPFTWDWHNLTPTGGNAYQWKYAWESHGWKTSTTPVAGSVAWFGYHVSYVKSVNDDGTVTLEEYNYSSDHLYGQRTIPASDVVTYLYPPK